MKRKFCVIMVVLALMALFAGCLKEEVSLKSDDHRVLVKINSFKKYLKKGAINNSGTKLSKVLFRGTSTLVYAYDYNGVYLKVTVIDAVDERKARKMYEKFMNGVKARYSFMQGVTLEKLKLSRKWGSKTVCLILTKKVGPMGNAFAVLQGNKVYHFILTGIYFNDARMFTKLVAPKLNFLQLYES